MKNSQPLQCDNLPLELIVTGDSLVEKQLDEVLEHLDSCKRCQDRLQIMLGLRSSLLPENALEGLQRSHTGGWQIAAVLAILVLSSILLLTLRPSGHGFSQWTSARPHPLFLLEVRAPESASGRADAFRLYQQGRYLEAAQSLANFPSDNQAQLYRGISLYLARQNQQAVEALSQLIQAGSPTSPEAHWFRAQAFLRLDLPDRALEDLRRIETGHAYADQAQKLIQRLERRH